MGQRSPASSIRWCGVLFVLLASERLYAEDVLVLDDPLRGSTGARPAAASSPPTAGG